MRQWAWLLVLGVTLGVWAPVLTFGWVETWDDKAFILANPHVREWSWVWMATTQWYGHWMPFTWLSFSANYALFGFHPASWHAVNMVLHAISAVLFYFIAHRFVGSVGGAVFAALFFAIHPLRMESVAWITERKDVLMGVFFLAAALLWLQGRRGWACAAFVASCASKSPAVVLPVMLLALEWWRDRSRLREHARHLAPFFVVSVLVSVMAFWSLGTILVSVPWSQVPLEPRLLHVAYSNVFYVMQTVWPARLSGLIEYTWVPSWDQPEYPIAVALVLLASWLLWRTRQRWPALTAAAVAYAVAVFPQAGLFQNGPQLVANRYSYLACLPLALLLGGAFTLAVRRWPRAAACSATAMIAALALVTLVNLPMWQDGDALWRYAARHEPTCTQCQDMATAADMRRGDYASAILRQRQAIRISDTTLVPRFERHWNLAGLLLMNGQPEEARREIGVYLTLAPETAAHVDHIRRARNALAQLDAGAR